MEIGYSNISSNSQGINSNTVNEQTQPSERSQIRDISSLSAGETFRGEILDIKGAQVSIGLESGQVVQAKLETGITLTIGQKLLFEVKSNAGAHIEIKPADISNNPNPVLQKALQAANLDLTQRNLDMVNHMLKEGLSIDKQSLTNMLRQLKMNPDTDPGIIVKMNKLGIEISKENIQQFENYRNYEHRIVKGIDHIANHLTELLGEISSDNKTSSVLFHNKLIDILNGTNINAKADSQNQSKEVQINQQVPSENEMVESELLSMNKNDKLINGTNKPSATQNQDIDIQSKNVQQNIDKSDVIIATKEQELTGNHSDMNLGNIKNPILEESIISTNLGNHEYGVLNGDNNNQTIVDNEKLFMEDENKIKLQIQSENQGKTLDYILNDKERASLADKVKELGANESQFEQIKEGKITNKELLNMVKSLLVNSDNISKSDSLFSSKEYIEVLKQTLKEQWIVEPNDLKEPDKMTSLYKKMDEQTRQLETMLESMGKDNTNAMKDISNIRSNINFMEQINQNFTYLQIPIQFSNEEAHSDLYVYTNKKNLKNFDGNLSVLLHLDMEVLGTTDIYIKMSGNQVNATFSFDDNESIEIVENHLEELLEKLQKKGYLANAQVEKREKQHSFVEDFLEKDKAVTSLQRYAFDVRM